MSGLRVYIWMLASSSCGTLVFHACFFWFFFLPLHFALASFTKAIHHRSIDRSIGWRETNCEKRAACNAGAPNPPVCVCCAVSTCQQLITVPARPPSLSPTSRLHAYTRVHARCKCKCNAMQKTRAVFVFGLRLRLRWKQ
jgi:hypothetical protein